MKTKLIKWMGILTTILLFSSPALASDSSLQNAASIREGAKNGTYTNPLPVQIPSGGVVESCADPSIIRGQTPGDSYWYMYCTTDPLNDNDKTGSNFNFRLIPMLRSLDLVNWTYMGDAFDARPGWVADDAGLWAPEIRFLNGQYYLYYTASWTDLPGGGSAIGVATSASPLGPWVDSGVPVVEPHSPEECCFGDKRWVFDPEVVKDNGQLYIFYGSYFGGISARKLSADGLHSDPASQKEITIANRYEGTELVKHGNYWYLFASATNCCNGPLTGYSVFVGRSKDVLGPYMDREGVPLMASRVGGTPVLSMNGNRWVGLGHNSVFEDFDGQWWTVYHAVDRNDPYFTSAVGFTKRPVLLDRIDWVDGWPTVRGGLWASDSPELAPAAQPNMKSKSELVTATDDQPGELISAFSDEFNSALGGQWSWVREPASGGYSVSSGTFNFNTQTADLHENSNSASVLLEAAPSENYIVEAKVKLSLPAEGCCFNFVQAGLVVYGGDDNYLKLVHVSIFETRQTEFAKELAPVPAGYPRYGNTVVGAPGEWTYLRIVKRDQAGEEHYTAYTSTDGEHWVRGGTWAHQLGSNAQIGLVSMGGSGFTANV
ncbi:MAG TPA: family 43 glycosylhydrolase, partial [Anaerolineales bacterium]|nr:family 43 glycosylhydrolase [Anaerolineales bacterium]